MEQGNPNVVKLPSESNINFAASGAGSLIIHQEEGSEAYAESTEHLPEVNEDLVQENPEFYHLSLRFYGQNGNKSQCSEGQYRSEPDRYSEDNRSDNQSERAEDSGYQDKEHYQKVRSYTDLTANPTGTRRKKSNVEYCYQNHDKLKELREGNKRLGNKSEDPVSIQGLLNNLKSGDMDYKGNLNGDLVMGEIEQGKEKGEEGEEGEEIGEKNINLPFCLNRTEIPGQASIGGYSLNVGRRAKLNKNLA